MLLAADLCGVVAAFALAEILIDGRGPLQTAEWWVLPVILPIWILTAKVYGLYDRDEERAAHTTVDDVVGVFHLVTVGVWLLLLAGRVSGAANPEFVKVAGFWLFAIVLVTGARAVARSLARRSVLYVQNMVVVGAGDVGQLIARKALLHPEYGINVVGFVDGEPREMRPELAPVPLLGPPDRLADVVRMFDVDRVVVAFSREPTQATLAAIRSLRRARRPGRRRAPAVRHRRPEGRMAHDRGDAPHRPPAGAAVAHRAGGQAGDRRRRRGRRARRGRPAARRDRAAGSASTATGRSSSARPASGWGCASSPRSSSGRCASAATTARTARTSAAR